MRMIFFVMLIGSTLGTDLSAQGGPAGAGPQMIPMRRMQALSPPPAFTGDTAQLPMDLSQVLPIVEVRIAGKPYRFVLDTGAVGHGRISPALAGTLGLKAGGETVASDGSGRTQTRRSYRLDALDLGGVQFRDLELSENARLPPRVDGVLGLGLFASHLLALDYPNATLSLTRGSLPESAKTYRPAPGRGITVPLAVGGETITAAIDTGNAIGQLVVPAAFAERLPRKGEPRAVGRASTAISTVQINEIDISLPVTLNGVALPVSTVTYPSLGELGNLGSRAFASTLLRIDQVNRRIDIRPVAPGRPAQASAARTTASTPAEAEVRAVEREWLDAYGKHDARAMDRIVAEEFTITYPGGRSMTKADVMAQIRSGPASGRVRFSTEQVVARSDGDTVLLTGVLVMQSPRGTQRMRYSDRWVRRDGRWQVVSSTLSSMPRE